MSRPNVLLIVLDTARAADVITSVNTTIDTLRQEGTFFPNTFATAPWSLPSHASIFTGTYSSKHGAHADHKLLENELRTLAEIFSEEGYETVAVSNNTWISEEFGFGRGFDTFHKTWQLIQSDIDLGRVARTREGSDKILSLTRKITDGNILVNIINSIYGQYFRKQSDDGAKQTNKWISNWIQKRAGSKPFFLFVNYIEPHLQYRPPKEFAEQFLPKQISYEEAIKVPQDAWRFVVNEVELSKRDFEILRSLYQAEIAYVDEQLGELKQMLIDANEWEDTIVIITGDHGENIGEHGLMDHQYCLYDTLLNVPLVLQGGPFTGEETSEEFVQLVDIAPTLVDILDLDDPTIREQFQGRSLHPTSDADPHEYVIAEYMAPQPSMKVLEERMEELPAEVYDYDRSLRSIRTGEYKYIRGSNGSRELYKVVDDSQESENVINDYPGPREKLDSALDSWLQSFTQSEKNENLAINGATKSRLEELGYLQ